MAQGRHAFDRPARFKREGRLAAPVLVEVRATLKPTEDADRVRQAILNLFPDAEVSEENDELVGRTTTLDRVRQLIRNMQIPDSARGAMLANLTSDGLSTRFLLGKQAAAVGKAHFGPMRSPLGDLEVTLRGQEPFEVERFIYHVAPDTTVPPELAEVPHRERPKPDEE